jgi:CubicO group peptidase (beta-lactamase class C family)
LALANRDGLVRVSNYGFADTKAGLRVVPETMFEIGSISKSFVSLALMQLKEEGKLDLNRPIVEYLPWLKINSKFEPVTTHHILSHTAGLPGVPLLLDAMLSDLWTGYAPVTSFSIQTLATTFLVSCWRPSISARSMIQFALGCSNPWA